jgi:hypothetical protein
MMKFEAVNDRIAVATNSLKPVRIVRSVVEPYDLNEWMIYMPEGDLFGNFDPVGPFDSFDDAKRYAEMEVGMMIKYESEVL